MVRIAVCDDDEKFAKKFIDIIKQEFIGISSDKEIECIYCGNSEEMIKTYLETEISAVFMDIEVGETSGFDIAKELVKIDDNLGVVYITSHDYYVTEAFVCRPLGFIRKEKLEIDCDRAFVSVNEYIQKKNRTIMFKDAFFSKRYSKEKQEILEQAAKNGINAEFVIRILETYIVSKKTKNAFWEALRLAGLDSEYQFRMKFAKELIMKQWWIEAEYNGEMTSFMLVPVAEMEKIKRDFERLELSVQYKLDSSFSPVDQRSEE